MRAGRHVLAVARDGDTPAQLVGGHPVGRGQHHELTPAIVDANEDVDGPRRAPLVVVAVGPDREGVPVVGEVEGEAEVVVREREAAGELGLQGERGSAVGAREDVHGTRGAPLVVVAVRTDRQGRPGGVEGDRVTDEVGGGDVRGGDALHQRPERRRRRRAPVNVHRAGRRQGAGRGVVGADREGQAVVRDGAGEAEVPVHDRVRRSQRRGERPAGRARGALVDVGVAGRAGAGVVAVRADQDDVAGRADRHRVAYVVVRHGDRGDRLRQCPGVSDVAREDVDRPRVRGRRVVLVRADHEDVAVRGQRDGAAEVVVGRRGRVGDGRLLHPRLAVPGEDLDRAAGGGVLPRAGRQSAPVGAHRRRVAHPAPGGGDGRLQAGLRGPVRVEAAVGVDVHRAGVGAAEAVLQGGARDDGQAVAAEVGVAVVGGVLGDRLREGSDLGPDAGNLLEDVQLSGVLDALGVSVPAGEHGARPRVVHGDDGADVPPVLRVGGDEGPLQRPGRPVAGVDVRAARVRGALVVSVGAHDQAGSSRVGADADAERCEGRRADEGRLHVPGGGARVPAEDDDLAGVRVPVGRVVPREGAGEQAGGVPGEGDRPAHAHGAGARGVALPDRGVDRGVLHPGAPGQAPDVHRADVVVGVVVVRGSGRHDRAVVRQRDGHRTVPELVRGRPVGGRELGGLGPDARAAGEDVDRAGVQEPLVAAVRAHREGVAAVRAQRDVVAEVVQADQFARRDDRLLGPDARAASEDVDAARGAIRVHR